MIKDLELTVKEIDKKLSTLKDSSLPAEQQLYTQLTQHKQQLLRDYKKQLTPWEVVYLARHEQRPKGMDLINALIKDMTFFHGDRLFGDDSTLVGGVGLFRDIPVTVLATRKGRTVKENLACNFGMSQPEGYRKALRLMKQAEKFKRPVLIFIDTPGAYPGIGAEERGQGEAIARNLMEMSRIKTPLISVVTGEGGSGGALGLSVSDRILMFEHATFSVLSPEGFASILWKDAQKAQMAAEHMKLLASDLKRFQVIDEIIPENIAFNIDDFTDTIKNCEIAIARHFEELSHKTEAELLNDRYQKFRRIGEEFLANKRSGYGN